jgi:hypothetical protein
MRVSEPEGIEGGQGWRGETRGRDTKHQRDEDEVGMAVRQARGGTTRKQGVSRGKGRRKRGKKKKRRWRG